MTELHGLAGIGAGRRLPSGRVVWLVRCTCAETGDLVNLPGHSAGVAEVEASDVLRWLELHRAHPEMYPADLATRYSLVTDDDEDEGTTTA